MLCTPALALTTELELSLVEFDEIVELDREEEFDPDMLRNLERLQAVGVTPVVLSTRWKAPVHCWPRFPAQKMQNVLFASRATQLTL